MSRHKWSPGNEIPEQWGTAFGAEITHVRKKGR